MQSVNAYHNIVYFSNLDESNSIICVCFPKNSEVTNLNINQFKIKTKFFMYSQQFYGYKDIFKYSNLIAMVNLKPMNKKEAWKYPCVLANENSIFTQQINSYKFLTSTYNKLAEKLKNTVRI